MSIWASETAYVRPECVALYLSLCYPRPYREGNAKTTRRNHPPSRRKQSNAPTTTTMTTTTTTTTRAARFTLESPFPPLSSFPHWPSPPSRNTRTHTTYERGGGRGNSAALARGAEVAGEVLPDPLVEEIVHPLEQRPVFPGSRSAVRGKK